MLTTDQETTPLKWQDIMRRCAEVRENRRRGNRKEEVGRLSQRDDCRG